MSDSHNSRFGDAQAHWRRGEFDAARGIYRELLAGDENDLEALLQLGHLEREQGRFDAAIELHRHAAQLSDEAVAHTALGRSLRGGGQAQAALDAFAAAIRADGDYPPAHLHLGELYGELGELDRAAACFATAARLDPNDPFARHNLGVSAQLAGDAGAAIGHFRMALQINPDYWRSCQALGDLLRHYGDFGNALTCYEKLVTLQPNADNFLRLGASRQLLGRFDEAVEAYRQALELDPGNRDAVYNLGTCFQATGQLDEAERLFTDVLAADPGHVSAVAALAGVHDRRGDYDEGMRLLLPVARETGANAELWVSLGRLARHAGRGDEVLPLLEAVLDEQEFSKTDRSRVAFTAGALRDAAGDYDLAFRHFRVANGLKTRDYRREEFERSVDRIIATFDTALVSRLRPRANADPRAVFVVGMPRSGSTLLERILAAHPHVATIGESPRLSQLAIGLATADNPYPEYVATAPAERLSGAAESYLAGLPGDRARVVDKMLSNLVHIGLIGVLFGGARVVHCRRHPLDTLLSCYSHDFLGNQVGFAYDFEDLAHYYRQYRRLMDHWDSLDAVPVATVDYEEVVGDTESTIRRLLDFLDLEWDDRCLEFHRTAELANTASYAQVRRPVYADSVGRHRHYAEHLQPLAEALREYLPAGE